MYISFAIIVGTFLAISSAQVNNLQVGTLPYAVTPGVDYTTSFINQTGSQFSVWIPYNASRVHINWIRSPSNSNGCDSSDYAYLSGRWATYPCLSGYTNFFVECQAINYATFGYSSSNPETYVLDAAETYNLAWWYSEYPASGEDFLIGDYLYLDSRSDVDTNCTATLNVTFDYCPSGSVAAADYSTGDTICVAYTDVSTLTYTESASNVAGPFIRYWMLNVPSNVSGISFVVKNADDSSFYLYSRPKSGPSYNDYYAATNGYDYYQGNGLYNYTLWIPNPPAGQFLVALESEYSGTYAFDVEIDVKSCSSGMAADIDGSCLYPLTVLPASGLNAPTLTVLPFNPAVDTECNWLFYSYPIAANTLATLNVYLSFSFHSAYVYYRRDAIPNGEYYDNIIIGDDVLRFTPDSIYLSRPTTYYFGFCNFNSTTNATFDVSFDYLPSSVPSPSSTPSASTPSASPDAASGSSSSLAISLLVILVTVILLF